MSTRGTAPPEGPRQGPRQGARQGAREGLRGADVLGPVVCNLAGILLVAVAWVAASGHPSFGAQLPFANLGVAGVLLAGAGDVVYLLGTRRLLRRRMARLAAGLGRTLPRDRGPDR